MSEMVNEFICKGEKFEPTKVESEYHLERLILENADSLFPNAYIFDFKVKAYTSLGHGTKPDLCLVSHDCTKWWIIEVERSKNNSYARTIQKQVSRQQDANWHAVTDQVISELIVLGASADLAENVKSADPDFILLYDEEDENISDIAKEHGFKRIILRPYLSNKGNYALVPILQEVCPLPSEINTLRVNPKLTKVVAGKLWVPIPSKTEKRIGNRKIVVNIDNQNSFVHINPKGIIQVPMSTDDDSESHRVFYRELNCTFDIDEDPENVILSFREERMWNFDD